MHHAFTYANEQANYGDWYFMLPSDLTRLGLRHLICPRWAYVMESTCRTTDESCRNEGYHYLQFTNMAKRKPCCNDGGCNSCQRHNALRDDTFEEDLDDDEEAREQAGRSWNGNEGTRHKRTLTKDRKDDEWANPTNKPRWMKSDGEYAHLYSYNAEGTARRNRRSRSRTGTGTHHKGTSTDELGDGTWVNWGAPPAQFSSIAGHDAEMTDRVHKAHTSGVSPFDDDVNQYAIPNGHIPSQTVAGRSKDIEEVGRHGKQDRQLSQDIQLSDTQVRKQSTRWDREGNPRRWIASGSQCIEDIRRQVTPHAQLKDIQDQKYSDRRERDDTLRRWNRHHSNEYDIIVNFTMNSLGHVVWTWPTAQLADHRENERFCDSFGANGYQWPTVNTRAASHTVRQLPFVLQL